jgi:uncharacterized protein (DUF433 family)
MSETAMTYVEKTAEGSWRIADSRVSLDSVVCAYWEGISPEVIVEEFPTLSVEQVYGVIAFYLRNRQVIDEYLAKQDAKWQDLAARSALEHQSLVRRLRKSRRTKAKD